MSSMLWLAAPLLLLTAPPRISPALPEAMAMTLHPARSTRGAASGWSNATLYHVNQKKFMSLGISNMNEGDAAGDMFFAIKSRALPVECPGAYDCNDPEMYAKNLVISKVTVELDMDYLQSEGLYAECNVNETGHGTGAPIYTCLCHDHGASGGLCNHSIGMQTVRSLPWYQLPKPGSAAPDFWRYNLAQRIGGQWWSTVAAVDGVGGGECTEGHGKPAGCSWRLVETVKVVTNDCASRSMNAAVVEAGEGAGCFKKCLQPTNTSSVCWVDCFYDTVLGPKGSTQPLVNTSHADDGLSTAQLLAMWAAPFDSDNLAEGGCPAVHA